MQTINTYIFMHPDHGTEAHHFDSAEEARTHWEDECETVHGNIINRATVWHMTDDCGARNVSDDWLEEIVEADRTRFNRECFEADEAANRRSRNLPYSEVA